MAHTVFRSDLMSGTEQAADLVSVKVSSTGLADGTPVAVDNGVIVELVAPLPGEREIWGGKLATSASDLSHCVVIASVEMTYDERRKALDDYYNEEGHTCRGYRLRTGNMFSLTKEGFVGAAAPAEAATVGIGADGLLESGATGFGICRYVETSGKYTYHTIQITKS